MSLNATGMAQAEDIAHALAVDLPFHIYASHVRRARETAEIVSKTHATPFTVLDDPAETDVGALDGLTDREMQEKYPEFVAEWLKDAATARPPHGETVGELQDRAWRAVQRLSNAHPDDTVVVVSHNFTVLTVVARVLDMPLRHFRRVRLDLGGITRIDLTEDKVYIVSSNETWHLRSRGRDTFDG